ncbi:MAG: ATP-binding protein [Polyangiaceae bacterium]|nr:ATP-binding protein [Polyangiaceae bacterium]
MLKKLSVKNVGPADEMSLELAPRLNLITGDNSLGKTFLLDIAWYALTHYFAGRAAIPAPSLPRSEISAIRTDASGAIRETTASYILGTGVWGPRESNLDSTALVLYAHSDGRISVFDRTRASSAHSPDFAAPAGQANLSLEEIWKGNHQSRGLLTDWSIWQGWHDGAFLRLSRVLESLSPSPNEPITPGTPRKIITSDPVWYPTLRTPDGVEVPIIHASAGIRRILTLSYMLVWAWEDHLTNVQLLQEPPTREIVFLIDEIEAHLHPQWQRRIVPALLNVANALTGDSNTTIQLIATTHAPLILSSVESMFDDNSDAWFDLDRVNGKVSLTKRTYYSHGEVDDWLTSEAFDLPSSRSLEGERAVKFAESLGDQESPSLEDMETAEAVLRTARLPEFDRFWIRWGYFVEMEKARIAAESAAQPQPAILADAISGDHR